MKRFYNVKEHLEIKNTNGLVSVVDMTIRQLNLLKELLIQKKAVVSSMILVTDEKIISPKGKFSDKDIENIIDALKTAVSISFFAVYEYWQTPIGDEIPGPFALRDHIELVLRSNLELSEELFYAMYSDVDCQGRGMTVAYGKKNGQLYFGLTDYTD